MNSGEIIEWHLTDGIIDRGINIKRNSNHLSYHPQFLDSDTSSNENSCALFVSGRELNKSKNYFQIQIVAVNDGCQHNICLGICSHLPLGAQPGCLPNTIAYDTGDGVLYTGSKSSAKVFGPKCVVGDCVGLGIRFQSTTWLFFTHNGREIGWPILVSFLQDGIKAFVALQSVYEEVLLQSDIFDRRSEEELFMVVDSAAEDDWLRLNNVRSNGNVLEYVGKGRSLIDVGLAQAKSPLCTRNYYFEIEIINPGYNCYIAIGVADETYPLDRHPGWNRGSIAYHADDGKLFCGSGFGQAFGPRCQQGDIMGCGILFPLNYRSRSDSEEEIFHQDFEQEIEEYSSGIVNDENLCDNKVPIYDGQNEAAKNVRQKSEIVESRLKPHENCIYVFFTRNGKLIGKKGTKIPRGGFYPTVGMMSYEEKVRVDLRPFSG